MAPVRCTVGRHGEDLDRIGLSALPPGRHDLLGGRSRRCNVDREGGYGQTRLGLGNRRRDHPAYPQTGPDLRRAPLLGVETGLSRGCQQDVLVTVIPRKSFEEILGAFPTVARNFIRLLSRRLVNIEQGFAGFGHTWSYHRLGKVFLQLGKEHGVDTPKWTVILLRLTHKDLAELIGTTRETVTTQINKFKRLGLLKREGRHFIVNTHLLITFLYPEEAQARPR